MNRPDTPKLTQQSTNNPTHRQSAESDDSRDGEETWRSLGATKERLRRGVSDSDVVAVAKGHLNDLSKVFKKPEQSPKIGRDIVQSPPAIVEEPKELQEEFQTGQEPSPQPKDPRKSWATRASSLLALKKLKERGKKGGDSCGELEIGIEGLRTEMTTGKEGLGLINIKRNHESEVVMVSPPSPTVVKGEVSKEGLKTGEESHLVEDEIMAESELESKEKEPKEECYR
ncbi:MAG: hypothetical protein LQ351_001512 [Letrouitia transgressa]|nr:MAG: hypothetical protein LQ351_001512 [Letrouitia transgressa]